MAKILLIDIDQLEILQIHHNLFGPKSQISQLFGIFLRKALITCPLSMARSFKPLTTDHVMKCDNSPHFQFEPVKTR